MTEKELVDLLSLHADNLKNGVDLTAEMVAQNPADDQRTLEALLALARRVQAALVQVEPKPDFVSRLRTQLGTNVRQAQLAAIQSKEARKRKLIWGAAGVGGLIYLVGLMLVGLRVGWALWGLVAGLLGWRMTRTTAPATRPRLTH